MRADRLSLLPASLDIRTLRLASYSTPSARITLTEQIREFTQICFPKDDRAGFDEGFHELGVASGSGAEKG
jgi:hypothetical protein